MYAITAANLRTAMETTSLKLDGSTTMTGALPLAVGSQGSPGLVFTGDADSGLYWIGANQLGIATGGLGRAQFDSSGITLLNGGGFIGPVTGALNGILGGTTPAAATVTTLAASGLATLSGGGNLTPAATPAVNSLGFLGMPQLAKSGDYTLTMADIGYMVNMTGSHTVNIPANASVAIPLGSIGGALVASGATLTLHQNSDTLRWVVTNGTGNRTVTGPGIIYWYKYAATEVWCWGINVA